MTQYPSASHFAGSIGDAPAGLEQQERAAARVAFTEEPMQTFAKEPVKLAEQPLTTLTQEANILAANVEVLERLNNWLEELLALLAGRPISERPKWTDDPGSCIVMRIFAAKEQLREELARYEQLLNVLRSVT